MLPWLALLAAAVIAAPSSEPEPGVDQPAPALVERARAEMKAHNYEQAIGHLDQALEQQPGDTAIEDLREEAKRQSADAYVQTGKKLLAQRKYDDARVAFNNALTLVPGHPVATRGLDAAQKWPTAEVYCKTAKDDLDKGDWDEAIAAYEKAYLLTKDPGIEKWLAAAKAAKAKAHH